MAEEAGARQAGSPGADPDIASAILEQATDIVQCRASCRVITGTVGDVEVRKTVLLNGFLLLANVVADTLKIAFAGITAAQGSGAFAEILVADSRGGRQPHFSLLLVSLNGDQIAVDYALPTVVTEAREESTTTPVFPLAQGDRGVDAVERWTSHEQIRDGVMSETVGWTAGAYPVRGKQAGRTAQGGLGWHGRARLARGHRELPG